MTDGNGTRGAWLYAVGGIGLAMVVRAWMSTLRYRGVRFDHSVDPVVNRYSGPCIYVFWHEYISFMFYLRGHCEVTMLLSEHRDAEFLSRAARYMGFGTVRGSSTRGGTRALRTMLRRAPHQSLTMTPDGPKGPRRKVAPGCAFLSSRLQLPIIPIGLAYERPWRFKRAWDQHALPRPGGRACFIMGPPIRLPEELDREGLERYGQCVEDWLNWLTAEAENWADSGDAYWNQVPARRQPKPLDMDRLGATTSQTRRSASL